MKTAMPKVQWGLSFSEFAVGAFVLVLVGVFALKLIPAYMENATVKNIFVEIANDPKMQGASNATIRESYVKRAMIDDVTAIKPDEIRVTSRNGRLELSAEYGVMLPLAGNINLYLEFNPSSAD